MGKKQIESYKKVRQGWEINPKSRVKEDKEVKDMCQECGLYETDPEACMNCDETIDTRGNA